MEGTPTAKPTMNQPSGNSAVVFASPVSTAKIPEDSGVGNLQGFTPEAIAQISTNSGSQQSAGQHNADGHLGGKWIPMKKAADKTEPLRKSRWYHSRTKVRRRRQPLH